MQPSETSGFGKTILVIFLLIWTLASAGMAAAMLGMSGWFSQSAGFPVSIVPWFFAIIPIGFTIIGVMLLFRIATAPAPLSPTVNIASSESAASPRASAPIACPGCGSRKNMPGARQCAHCGGAIPS